MISLRVVNVDHYMTSPVPGLDVTYSEFRGAPVKQVPILRIFGSTDTGKKTCLHVHGVFPYIYVPYDGGSSPGQLMYQLAAGLDKALNISLGTSNSTRHHVYRIVHVAGRPFYGYHNKFHQYFKIFFYNPLIVKRASDLLQNGAICNKVYQCHEAHVPFILQFFIDYNLYGMSFIELSKVLYRKDGSDLPDLMESVINDSANDTNIELPPRVTFCEIEIDGQACDILNSKTSSDSVVANPGLAGIWAEEKVRRRNNFGTSQLTMQNSQQRTNAQPTISEVILRDRLKEAIDILRLQHVSPVTVNKSSTQENISYPAESQDGNKLLEASFLDHNSMQNTDTDVTGVQDVPSCVEEISADMFVVNEELVLSLSQAIDESFLGSQDFSLLLMMQSLAACNNESEVLSNRTINCSQQVFNDHNIEEGSLLAPSLERNVNELDQDELGADNGIHDEEVGDLLVNTQLGEEGPLADQHAVWNNTFWNNVNEVNIPQLDGAIDELDNNSNKKQNENNAVLDLDSEGSVTCNNNLEGINFNKLAPGDGSSNDVEEAEDDDTLDDLKHIFDQDDPSNDDRFWNRDQVNVDKELQGDIFRENMNSSLTFNSDNIVMDDAVSFIADDGNEININMDSSFNNVLMGDPSLTNQEIVEPSSEDFVFPNRTLPHSSWSSNVTENSKQKVYQNENDEMNYFAKVKENETNNELFPSLKIEDPLNDVQPNKEVNLEFTESTSDSVLYPTSELLLSCINDDVSTNVADAGQEIKTIINNSFDQFEGNKKLLTADEDTSDSNKKRVEDGDENVNERSVTDLETKFTSLGASREEFLPEENQLKSCVESSSGDHLCDVNVNASQCNFREIQSFFKINKKMLKWKFFVKTKTPVPNNNNTDTDSVEKNGAKPVLKQTWLRYKCRCKYKNEAIRPYADNEVDSDLVEKYYQQLKDLKKLIHERETSTTVKPIHLSWNDIDKEMKNYHLSETDFVNQKVVDMPVNKNLNKKDRLEIKDEFGPEINNKKKNNMKENIQVVKSNLSDKTIKIKKSEGKDKINIKKFCKPKLADNSKNYHKINSNANKPNKKVLPMKNKTKNKKSMIVGRRRVLKSIYKKVTSNMNGKKGKKKSGLDKEIHICKSLYCKVCSADKKINRNLKSNSQSPKSNKVINKLSELEMVAIRKNVVDKNKSPVNKKKVLHKIKQIKLKTSTKDINSVEKRDIECRSSYKIGKNFVITFQKKKLYPCVVMVTDMKYLDFKEQFLFYGINSNKHCEESVGDRNNGFNENCNIIVKKQCAKTKAYVKDETSLVIGKSDKSCSLQPTMIVDNERPPKPEDCTVVHSTWNKHHKVKKYLFRDEISQFQAKGSPICDEKSILERENNLPVPDQLTSNQSVSLDVKIFKQLNMSCDSLSNDLANNNPLTSDQNKVPSRVAEQSSRSLKRRTVSCSVDVPSKDMNSDRKSILINSNSKMNVNKTLENKICSNNNNSSESNFKLSCKRLKISSNISKKMENRFKKSSNINYSQVPCLDGTVDEQSSLSSDDSEENFRHKKKKIKINKSKCDNLNDCRVKDVPCTPKKRRYEPLEVLIKKSPKLSSKVEVVVRDVSKGSYFATVSSHSVTENVKSGKRIDLRRNMHPRKLRVKITKVDKKLNVSDRNNTSLDLPSTSRSNTFSVPLCESPSPSDSNEDFVEMKTLIQPELTHSISDGSIFSEEVNSKSSVYSTSSLVKPCFVLLRKEDKLKCQTETEKHNVHVITSDSEKITSDDRMQVFECGEGGKIIAELKVSLRKISEKTERVQQSAIKDRITTRNEQQLIDSKNFEDNQSCDNKQIEFLLPNTSDNDRMFKDDLKKGVTLSQKLPDDGTDDDSGNFLLSQDLIKNTCRKQEDEDMFIVSDEDEDVGKSTGSSGVRKALKFSDKEFSNIIEIKNDTKNICDSNLQHGNESSSDTVITMCSNDIANKYSDDIFGDEDDDDNNGILSFYDKTVYFGDDNDEVENSVDHSDSNSIINFERYSSFSESETGDDNKTVSHIRNCTTSQKSNYDEIVGDNVGVNRVVIYVPQIIPPSCSTVLENLSHHNLTENNIREPFYSNSCDCTGGVEIGGVKLKINSNSVVYLEEFQGSFDGGLKNYRNTFLQNLFEDAISSSSIIKHSDILLATERNVVLVPLNLPPMFSEAKKWLTVKYNLGKISGTDCHDPVPNLDKTVVNIDSRSCLTESPNSVVTESKKSFVFDSLSDPLNTSPQVQSEPVDISVAHSTPVLRSTIKSLPLPVISPSCTPVISKNKSRKCLLNNFNKKNRLSDKFKKYPVLPLIDEEATSFAGGKKNCSGADGHLNSVKSQELSSSSNLSDKTKLRIEAQLKDENKAMKRNNRSSSSNIDGATPNNSYEGVFKRDIENLQDARSIVQHQYLTLLAVEVHVQTRGDLRPDPDLDPVRAIFYYISNDVPSTSSKPAKEIGIICIGELEKSTTVQFDSVLCVSDEHTLVIEFIKLVRKWDPDIFLGFEIEMLSWGYLIQRAYSLNLNLNIELSRVIGSEGFTKYEDEKGMLGGDNEELEIKLAGRIVLNVWRLLRHEIALQSYTFENLMYHILHRRIPLFTFRVLSNWWEHRSNTYRWMVVEHYLTRVKGIIQLLDQLDLIGRTSELAKLFGIQFYEVLSRGSQYRVESMMLRLAKPQNYVAVSPSVQQRAKMRAPESLPLIMEPQSKMYNDPVIVLDFQSLYPSMIIAYNYCYSTCLGRVEHLAKSEIYEFGCTHLRVPFKTIVGVQDNLNYSPCGVAFVNSSIRKGILPIMLEEILNTRLMVKKSMKENKGNKALERVLHNRQLGLKLIANVTYGYTAANFSGRMPSVEIGDSVVSKGRETLERAIAMVNKSTKWGAEVVYGDTDSLFVLVRGKTRKQAFKIGAEIADAVTNDNPKPVKLKLEKVYQPCVLQTKKRYVGYMYESPDQETPVYDAKGIETVRRDGCPAVAKILEKSLRLLFETKDVSLVKQYVSRQFSKILTGRLSIQELTFAKEYRGAAGYRPTACVPALELAKEWCSKDKRAEPRVGERVPYVIVSGHPGVPLIKLVRSPYSLLEDPGLKINAEYYVTRAIIPPLNRCFLLIGANVSNWYTDLPKKYHTYLPTTIPVGVKKATISQYFATVNCVACQRQTMTGVCYECQSQPQKLSTELAVKIHDWERKDYLTKKICQSCCGRSDNIDCISLDCPVLYKLYQTKRDLNQSDFIRQLQHDYLSF